MTLTSDVPSNLSELASPEFSAGGSSGLSPERSAGAAVLAQWLSQADGIAQSSMGKIPEAASDERRLLRFGLQGQESALMALDSIQEVLQIPKQAVLRVPEMAKPVLGVANRRGSILWLVDLGLLLGLDTVSSEYRPSPTWQPLNRAQQLLNAVIIHAAGQCLGLVVPQVMDIETQDASQIQPPNADLFPPLLLPFLEGYLARSCSPILSATALIERLQMTR